MAATPQGTGIKGCVKKVVEIMIKGDSIYEEITHEITHKITHELTTPEGIIQRLSLGWGTGDLLISIDGITFNKNDTKKTKSLIIQRFLSQRRLIG